MRFLLLLFLPIVAFSQSTNATLNEDYYHWITRYEIKAGRIAPEIFTTIKPFRRKNIVEYVDSLNVKDNVFSSAADKFNYEFLRNDNWEWSRAETSNSKKSFLGFYKKKSDLIRADEPDFDFHANPVLYCGLGKDNTVNGTLYTNTRGVELRGIVDKKIGFYTFLTDNQMLLPQYVQNAITLNGVNVVPHEGFWKSYKYGKGVDFLQARGYIDFSVTKHINTQFGYDRTFIGNGFRSLIFSDYSPPNLFLRFNVKVWKINYLFQLNRLTANAIGTSSGSTPNSNYPVKYFAFHHASVNIGKKLNIGVFESVIFAPQDTVNKNTFQLNYLNPIIFYRAIAQQGGNPDKVLLGGDFKWNMMKKVSVYGQALINEFVWSEIKSGKGWWGNKFAFQGGLKYIDAFNVSNLDIQLEGNLVRPYMYTSGSQYDSYSNYNQSLAHPLGANFVETIAIIRYQPIPKLNLTLKTFYAKIGRDTTGVDWGSDILKNYNLRQNDYGNKIGQGIKNTIAFVDFTASFMLKHNLFIDFKAIIRQNHSPVKLNAYYNQQYNTNSNITSISLRWNIPQRTYDF